MNISQNKNVDSVLNSQYDTQKEDMEIILYFIKCRCKIIFI